MNEIFNDYYPSNACKQSKCGGGMSVCVPSDNNPDDENMVQFADVITFANGGNIVLHSATEGDVGDAEAAEADEADEVAEADEAACVSFAAATVAKTATDGDADATDAIEIDRMVDTIISSSEEYEKKFREDADGDTDTMSVSSEITFTSDEKKNEKKKYAKMSLDKLKDLCNQGNLNNDGTRNQLITRIIEAKR